MNMQITATYTQRGWGLPTRPRTRRDRVRDAVLIATAAAHGVGVTELTGPGQSRYIVRARWDAMAVFRAFDWSTPEIGRVLNRDHTTVIHGAREVRKLTESMADEIRIAALEIIWDWEK